MAIIKGKESLANNIYRLTIEAKEIAQKRKPGQFIILRISEGGERIPLTITDSDSEKGVIDLIVQAVGKTTRQLVQLRVGEDILDLVGPLGVPTKIEKKGTVVVVGGGVGAAPLYPIAKALKETGNEVIAILGARSRDFLILEEEFRNISDKLIVVTDDGSLGEQGVVTDPIKKLLSEDNIQEVVTIGPLIMMKYVSLLTKEYSVSTVVSLNTLMIDGTGMCGGCRVTVGGETRFTCVHGPEFDGHKVDFDNLLKRAKTYEHEEKCRLDQYLENN